MKILHEYVLDSIRKNKKSSVAIMISLFLMTTMMSCFCGFVYTMWTDSIALSKWENGDWHGELFDTTSGKDLEKIENYASVSAVLIKGNWEAALLPTDGKRNYIVTRGANKEYWDSMPEKDTITKGRAPKKADEIALSKQYFDDFPETNIGDQLTLPVGQRMNNGNIISEVDSFHETETFHQTGTKTYTIVGEMDVTTSSIIPAYTGLGFLDTSSLSPDDRLTIYLRFDPMRSTYEELPALAKSIGYTADEYGEYRLRYNASVLSKYLILSPEQKDALFDPGTYSVPLMFLVLTLMIICLFVLVIHNAFALSAGEKVSQLGTLSGIGATPRQITSLVTTEALILLAVPLPAGILSGWFLDMKLFEIINNANHIGRSAPAIVFTFGIVSILPAAILSILTAWLSALIPAKKIARLMPIEALRQESRLKNKKLRTGRIARRFGITGELASTALSARRKSYRTATISLCLSFLLLTGFQYIITAQEAAKSVYQTQEDRYSHIQCIISDGRNPEQKVWDEIHTIPEIKGGVIYNELPCATWITAADVSEDINENLGGLDEIVAKKKYSTIKRDGKYRIYSTVLGLESESFRSYCKELKIDPEPYFSDPSMALIYNKTEDPDKSSRKTSILLDLLKLKTGDTLNFTEKAYDEDEGNHEFQLTAGRITDTLPSKALTFPRFTLIAVMPMEHVLDIAASCSPKRQNSGSIVYAQLLTDSTGKVSFPAITKASKKVEKVLTSYYGSGDYSVADLAMREEMQEDSGRVINMIVIFLTGLLAVIGLSNVWSSISGNLRQRSREFAMLKSVGLSPKQLAHMLFLEGLSLGLKPVLLSLPFQAFILILFLQINEITWAQYLPHLPAGIILGYTLLILLAVTGAYIVGGRRIQKDNIITAVKDDTL